MFLIRLLIVGETGVGKVRLLPSSMIFQLNQLTFNLLLLARLRCSYAFMKIISPMHKRPPLAWTIRPRRLVSIRKLSSCKFGIQLAKSASVQWQQPFIAAHKASLSHLMWGFVTLSMLWLLGSKKYMRQHRVTFHLWMSLASYIFACCRSRLVTVCLFCVQTKLIFLLLSGRSNKKSIGCVLIFY